MNKTMVQFNARMIIALVGLVAYLYATTWIGLSYPKQLISYEIEATQEQAAYPDNVVNIAQKSPYLVSTAELSIMLEHVNQHKLDIVNNSSGLTQIKTLELEQELKINTELLLDTVNHLLNPYVILYQSILHLIMVTIIILLVKLATKSYPKSSRAQNFGQKISENPHLLTMWLVSTKVLISGIL